MLLLILILILILLHRRTAVEGKTTQFHAFNFDFLSLVTTTAAAVCISD